MQVMLDQLRSVPLENQSLVDAIRKQCEALGFRTGAAVDFQLDELPPSEALAPGAHEAFLPRGPGRAGQCGPPRSRPAP